MAAIHLHLEIGLQGRRKQQREEGTLVVTLPADEHHDFVIHHLRVENRGEDAYKPLAEIGHELFLTAFHVYGTGQLADVIGPVPRGERSEIGLERMEKRHILGLKHIADVLQADFDTGLLHAAPQGVLVAVGNGQKFPRRVLPRNLALPTDDIETDRHL